VEVADTSAAKARQIVLAARPQGKPQRRTKAKSQTKQEKNKALVLEAFDTLFHRRDYAAAERFWSPHYIQHSAYIAPGCEGLFNLVKSFPPTLTATLSSSMAAIPGSGHP
jgi:hypothetical protein